MLFSNQKNKYKKIVIDDCTMKFKVLSYNEVKLLEEKAKEIGEDFPKLFFYICENYVRDENGEKVTDENMVNDLPVEFVAKVINKFFSNISANLTEDEIKKN